MNRQLRKLIANSKGRRNEKACHRFSPRARAQLSRRCRRRRLAVIHQRRLIGLHRRPKSRLGGRGTVLEQAVSAHNHTYSDHQPYGSGNRLVAVRLGPLDAFTRKLMKLILLLQPALLFVVHETPSLIYNRFG